MMESIKLVTIGGGSSYTPELVEGMILRSHLISISEWWFVDVPEGEEKLNIVVELAKRMVEKAGLDWKIKATLNRQEALKDADFVTSQFRVGGLDARYLDESIPLSMGIIGQETNGAGGIFKAFRTIVDYKSIIADMKELCPEAWLINFTNPAGMVTEALINRLGWKKTIGLCNIPIGQQKAAANELGLEESELTLRHVGLNHYHFHQVWDKQGNNRTGELIERFYGPLKAKEQEAVKNITNLEFPISFLRSIQMLPCDYHRYYFLEKEMLEDAVAQYREGHIRAAVVKDVEKELFDLYQNPNLKEKPKQLEQRGGAYYSDIACQIIVAIITDSHETLTVSTVNHGVIPFLPKDSVVEVSAMITSQGAIPLATPVVPKVLEGQLQLMKKMELVTVDAAISGDYHTALQAFFLNPLIPNGSETERLLKELLLAHETYLPQFQPTIAAIKEGRL
ncbi:6-phospho-beta-glucosidase [Streptococcus jiangjianxini]|uniref:6-phospho-beta-glucosidase n=1 Tax=Streptococcus jiangjianxini TaxID=3161189 RepID=UPI0032EF2EE0